MKGHYSYIESKLLEPKYQLIKERGVQLVVDEIFLLCFEDELALFEEPQMVAQRLRGDSERLGELACRHTVVLFDKHEDVPAQGVGQGLEGRA